MYVFSWIILQLLDNIGFSTALDGIIDDFSDLIQAHYGLKTDFGDPSAPTDVSQDLPRLIIIILRNQTGRSRDSRTYNPRCRDGIDVKTGRRCNGHRIVACHFRRCSHTPETGSYDQDQRSREGRRRVWTISWTNGRV